MLLLWDDLDFHYGHCAPASANGTYAQARLMATLNMGTVASAGSPLQPPRFHKTNIVAPKRSPLAANGTREPRGA